jgi:hypothetical protein
MLGNVKHVFPVKFYVLSHLANEDHGLKMTKTVFGTFVGYSPFAGLIRSDDVDDEETMSHREPQSGLFVPSWVLSLVIAGMLTGLGSALTYWFQFGKIEERVDQLSKSFAKLEAIDTIKREEWKLFVEQVRNDLREIKEHQRRQ